MPSWLRSGPCSGLGRTYERHQRGILRINRDMIEKKKEIEEGDTLRYHLIDYTDGKREKQLDYI